MCGIAGIVVKNGFSTGDELSLVEAMIRRLRHRGPDNEQSQIVEKACFGHSRLSIIDLSESGNQPMVSDDGNVMLVCNGEIYNFRILRKQLIEEGAVFKSDCDSEVVLRGYQVWGERIVEALEGMFSLAIWEKEEQKLLLARDRFGIKPLYVWSSQEQIIFASEIKAILLSSQVDKRANIQGLSEFLWFGNSLGPNTAFEGIEEISPGELVIYRDGRRSSRRYWRPEELQLLDEPPRDVVGEVWERFSSAVESHLISDVPVGLFLSGGLDSSAIAWCASRHLGSKLKSYSVGFDFEKGVNELPKARAVAKICGTEHHEMRLEGKDIPSVVEKLMSCHDEPFADAANIPLYLLCEQLQGSAKVILQGDGGDEILGGYRRHEVLSRWKFWTSVGQIYRRLSFLTPQMGRWRGLRRFVEALLQSDPGVRMALMLTIERLEEPPERLFKGAFKKMLMQADPFRKYQIAAERFGKLDPLQSMLYTDSEIILPDDFLEKVDRSTMAHGIEVRVPFLDCKLTNYVMALPSSTKVKKGSTKWLLREGLRGKIPDSILDMPKTGFGVPYGYWLQTSLREMTRDVLLDKSSELGRLIDRRVTEKLIEQQLRGEQNHAIIVWKLLHLGMWLEKYSISL